MSGEQFEFIEFRSPVAGRLKPVAAIKPLIIEIHQVNPVCWAGQSSIEPPEIIESYLIPVEHSLVDENPFPLTALGFMTRNCISELYLNSKMNP